MNARKETAAEAAARIAQEQADANQAGDQEQADQDQAAQADPTQADASADQPVADASEPTTDQPAATGSEQSVQAWENAEVDGKVVCAFPVAQGTEQDGRVKPTKPCLKEPGHEGDHSSRKYTKVDLSNLDLGLFDSLEDVPGDFNLTDAIPWGDRDERQRKVDEQVKAAYDRWVEAGRREIEGFADAIAKGYAKRYFSELDQIPGIKKLLIEAGKFHGIRVRVDKPRKHVSGKAMTVWYTSDKVSATDSGNPPDGSEGAGSAEGIPASQTENVSTGLEGVTADA